MADADAEHEAWVLVGRKEVAVMNEFLRMHLVHSEKPAAVVSGRTSAPLLDLFHTKKDTDGAHPGTPFATKKKLPPQVIAFPRSLTTANCSDQCYNGSCCSHR